MKDEVMEYREKLIEAVADYDETLMENSLKIQILLLKKKSMLHLELQLLIYHHSYDLWFFIQKIKEFSSC